MEIALHTLLNQIGMSCDATIRVNGIQADSRNVETGNLFIAISGHESDGHEYINQAVENGAVAVIGEKDLELLPVPYFKVQKSRELPALFSTTFYQEPHKKHKMIGITGTNGKTTTAHIIKHILTENGKTASMFGTVGYHLNGVEYESTLTTPDAISIQKMLHESKDEYVVMEISSHGLDQYRVTGPMFDYGIFTNLSHDHLDYHLDLEDYYKAKKRLFSCLKKEGKAIVGAYNPWGERLHTELAEELVPSIRYGHKEKNEPIFLREYSPAPYARLVISDYDQEYEVNLKMAGVHNVLNGLGSYICTRELGFTPAEVIGALESFEGAPGRFEVINIPNGGKAILDYAHTPDGLYHALTTARMCVENKLVHIFGFRGNRDVSKRSDMVEISRSLSDQVILTLDDLNGIEKESMVEELYELSSSHSNVMVIEDRTEAIRLARSLVQEGDGLIVTGKGPERYKERFKYPTKTDKETILKF